MSLGAPKSAPATREQLESHKRDARGLLEAMARAIQEGRAAGQRLTSGSLAYTVFANTEAEFQVNLLMTEFQKVFLGQRPGDQSFRPALIAELTRWGIQNSKAHPIDPLISPEMDRALDVLYESFAATLGVPPVAASAPATVAELPVAAVTGPAAEVAQALLAASFCSTDPEGFCNPREPYRRDYSYKENGELRSRHSIAHLRSLDDCAVSDSEYDVLGEQCAALEDLAPGSSVLLTKEGRGSVEIGPAQRVLLFTNSESPMLLATVDTSTEPFTLIIPTDASVFSQHRSASPCSIAMERMGPVGGAHTVSIRREDVERRRMGSYDVPIGFAVVQFPPQALDISRGEHVTLERRYDGIIEVTDRSKRGTLVVVNMPKLDAGRSEEAAAVPPAAAERPAASRRPQPEPVRPPARRLDDHKDDDGSSCLVLGSLATGFVFLASAAVCAGGLIYARPPAWRASEPSAIPIAPTPLQVLCKGGIPVTHKFKKETGKTDVFKDGKEGVYQFALIDGGVVVAALAGSVPESCFDGKMPASFTDFRNVELVVTKAVRYVNPNDLSFGNDIARYTFEPVFQPRVKPCPEKLPFPEWYTNGPYYQRILKPGGSFVRQTINVALHRNLGWTASDTRLETAVTLLYVNEGATQKHPSCVGYLHDVEALEGMSLIDKLAHSNRSKFDLY